MILVMISWQNAVPDSVNAFGYNANGRVIDARQYMEIVICTVNRKCISGAIEKGRARTIICGRDDAGPSLAFWVGWELRRSGCQQHCFSTFSHDQLQPPHSAVVVMAIKFVATWTLPCS